MHDILPAFITHMGKEACTRFLTFAEHVLIAYINMQLTHKWCAVSLSNGHSAPVHRVPIKTHSSHSTAFTAGD